MQIDLDLYTKLATLAPSAAIQQDNISEDKGATRIAFLRQATDLDLMLNGDSAITTVTYLVEVGAEDIDACQTVKDQIRALNGFVGTMGSTIVKGAFVNDITGEYIPKMLNADEGFYIEALEIDFLY